MPKFSATGVIPFAKSGSPPKAASGEAGVKSEVQAVDQEGGKEEKEVDLWEVPETPAK